MTFSLNSIDLIVESSQAISGVGSEFILSSDNPLARILDDFEITSTQFPVVNAWVEIFITNNPFELGAFSQDELEQLATEHNLDEIHQFKQCSLAMENINNTGMLLAESKRIIESR